MWRLILLSAQCCLIAACSNIDDRARAVLSKAETECGLDQGTFSLMGVNDVYDEEARKPSGKKVIIVQSQSFRRHEVCVNRVARVGGFDRVERFVYDGTDPG